MDSGVGGNEGVKGMYKFHDTAVVAVLLLGSSPLSKVVILLCCALLGREEHTTPAHTSTGLVDIHIIGNADITHIQNRIELQLSSPRSWFRFKKEKSSFTQLLMPVCPYCRCDTAVRNVSNQD